MGRGIRFTEDTVDSLGSEIRTCVEEMAEKYRALEAEKDSLLEQLSEANSLVSELQDRVRELETALEEERMGDDI